MLVAIEGIDRAGKSTLIDRLRTSTELPFELLTFRTPDRDCPETGSAICRFLGGRLEGLSKHDVHHLFVRNRKVKASEIQRALDDRRGDSVVVVDRWSASGIAYGHAAEGLDWDWLIEQERDIPVPDLTILLDLSPEDAQRRFSFGRERYDDVQKLLDVRRDFLELARTGKRWMIVDASKSSDAVVREVAQSIVAAWQARRFASAN